MNDVTICTRKFQISFFKFTSWPIVYSDNLFIRGFPLTEIVAKTEIVQNQYSFINTVILVFFPNLYSVLPVCCRKETTTIRTVSVF